MRFQSRFVVCEAPSQPMSVRNSSSATCNLCASARVDGHSMTHTYFFCNCQGSLCEIKFAKKQCRSNEAIFQWSVSPGEHAVVPENTVLPPPKLSSAMKEYIRTNMNVKPPVILHADLLAAGHSCNLKQVQNFVYQERLRQWSDDVPVCSRIVQASTFFPSIEPSAPFFFGQGTMPGQLLGEGTEEDPLMVGVTTVKTLNLLRHLNTVGVLCLDATYALNGKELPVIVYGVTDLMHSFHPVAFFLVSEETEQIFQATMSGLTAIAFVAAGIELRPPIVLSDGAKAIHSAVSSYWPQAEHLMCYAHMCMAVRKHFRTPRFRLIVSMELYQLIRSQLYRLYKTKSIQEYNSLRAEFLPTWPTEVADYLNQQWLEGQCSRWQEFTGRPNGVHSNQGQECFNRLLKTFSFRRRGKISECLNVLHRVMAYAASRTDNPFITSPVNSTTFASRSRRGPSRRRVAAIQSATESNSGRPPRAQVQRRRQRRSAARSGQRGRQRSTMNRNVAVNANSQ